jgi:hypothetical protein
MAERKFPNNSVEGRREREDEPKPEKKISGEVVKRKKSLGVKMKETFITGDFSSVISDGIQNLVIPSLIETFDELCHNFIDGMIYGNDAPVSGSRRRGRSGRRRTTERTSYDQASKRKSPKRGSNIRNLYLDDIGFDDKVEADIVYEELLSDLEERGEVYVKNLYRTLGWDIDYTFDDYGWTDLHGMHVEYGRVDGEQKWFLCLPKLEYLG